MNIIKLPSGALVCTLSERNLEELYLMNLTIKDEASRNNGAQPSHHRGSLVKGMAPNLMIVEVVSNETAYAVEDKSPFMPDIRDSLPGIHKLFTELDQAGETK